MLKTSGFSGMGKFFIWAPNAQMLPPKLSLTLNAEFAQKSDLETSAALWYRLRSLFPSSCERGAYGP